MGQQGPLRGRGGRVAADHLRIRPPHQTHEVVFVAGGVEPVVAQSNVDKQRLIVDPYRCTTFGNDRGLSRRDVYDADFPGRRRGAIGRQDDAGAVGWVPAGLAVHPVMIRLSVPSALARNRHGPQCSTSSPLGLPLAMKVTREPSGEIDALPASSRPSPGPIRSLLFPPVTGMVRTLALQHSLLPPL
jgi:hypothetical protein